MDISKTERVPGADMSGQDMTDEQLAAGIRGVDTTAQPPRIEDETLTTSDLAADLDVTASEDYDDVHIVVTRAQAAALVSLLGELPAAVLQSRSGLAGALRAELVTELAVLAERD
jgi:hypothetical protein